MPKKQFKVGSLDQLMELMDTFAKYDLQIDASCKRNESLFHSTAAELNKKDHKLVLEIQQRGGKKETKTVHEYLKNFKWDSTKFQVDKSLKVLGAKVIGIQRSCDEKLKKRIEEQNDIKNKLAALTKKESKSFLVKDLGDLIYEHKISAQWFVNTHGSKIMTTVLVAVPKKMI